MSDPATEEPVCPICRGAKFVRREVPPGHPHFGRAIPCECSTEDRVERHRARLRALSNLDALGHCTFDTFSARGHGWNSKQRSSGEQALEASINFARNPQGWLILRGPCGCGKTHLAAAIANYRLERGRQPVFVVVPDLLDHLRASFAPTSKTGYDERFQTVRDAELLILDDLGTHNATPWAQEKLYQIFNYRYAARLPTVVTTNLSLDRIDTRIRSRMMDTTLTSIHQMELPDYRNGTTPQDSSLSLMPLLQHLTFDTFNMRGLEVSTRERDLLRFVYNACRTFGTDPTGWLVISGKVGVGKTHLAAAIANMFVQTHNQPALYIVVPDLLDHLRATFAPNSTVSYDQRFDEIRSAPLLILDDMDAHSATPWAQEKLFQIFNHRYLARLPTVVCIKDISELPTRIIERLLDMKALGRGALLALDVPPYRSMYYQDKLNKPNNRNGSAPHSPRSLGRRLRGQEGDDDQGNWQY